MKETELSKAIRDKLTEIGVWSVRIASGTINVGKRWIRMSEPGTPDIWTPFGWLEIKTKTGKVSDVQKAWHSKAQENNVNVKTVRSVDEAVETIINWKKDKENEAN